MISYQDFEQVDIRVGTVLMVDDFSEAKKPAYKLTIDFGPEIGIKKSNSVHRFTVSGSHRQKKI